MSSEVVGDLQRRLANIVRRGVIHSIKHGDIPKCRVSIGALITDWLPLCQGFSGQYRSDVNPCCIGDAVTVLSEAGDLNNGRVFPGWATGNRPVPQGSEGEHITVYGDGTEVRYNRESHALTIMLAEGGTYLITGSGTLDGPVNITGKLTVEGETYLRANTRVKGNLSVSAEISDAKGKMSAIRTTYNGHTHRETDSTTRKPDQQM